MHEATNYQGSLRDLTSGVTSHHRKASFSFCCTRHLPSTPVHQCLPSPCEGKRSDCRLRRLHLGTSSGFFESHFQFLATNALSTTVVGMEMFATGAFLCSSSRQSEVDFQVRMTDYFSVLGPPCILKGPPNLESSSINGAKKYVPTKRTHTLLLNL